MHPELATLLETTTIRFVRILWCDNAGLIRGKAVHLSALDRFLPYGVGITPAQQAVPVMADAPVADSGLGPVGEIRLVPDWSTLTALPYAAEHARVLGDMKLDGQPWALCPRDFLSRMIAEAAVDGLEIESSFENEFFLLRPSSGGPVAADDTLFATTWSMDQHWAFINDFTDALTAQGLHIECYYPESAPGQQEVSIRHAPAMLAADHQIVFRETARAVALRHDLRVSFLPKIFADQAGCGAHLHLSLWRDGRNLLPDPSSPGGLSAVGRSFVAGILEHLPALMAVTTPTPNSYRRLQPGCWAGAFQVWGMDNREAAIRIPSNPTGEGTTNFEVKTVDATCNPYLALGVVLAAGLDGVRKQRVLPPEVRVDPATLTDAERQSQGIVRLPGTLGEALEHFEGSALLKEAMGPALHRAFLAVRRAEWHALRERSLEEEVRLLWERY